MYLFRMKAILFIMVLSVNVTLAQKAAEKNPSGSLPDEHPNMIIDHKEFGEDFCLFRSSDSRANYYVIDLEKLPTDFSKAYFMNLVFEQDDIVNIDSDFDKNYMWFKAFKLYDKDAVLKKFSDLKRKTDHASDNFSSEKKYLWMEINAKF